VADSNDKYMKETATTGFLFRLSLRNYYQNSSSSQSAYQNCSKFLKAEIVTALVGVITTVLYVCFRWHQRMLQDHKVWISSHQTCCVLALATESYQTQSHVFSVYRVLCRRVSRSSHCWKWKVL